MVDVTPDGNFQSLSDSSVHDNQSEKYQKYRRCWNEYPRSFILRDFPLHLDIEATNHCNLRCTFCDKLPWKNPDSLGFMDFNLFRKIVDEGAEHELWGLKLSYRGEPLLHKNIFEMIRYAKTKGILDVFFNSNGMLLNADVARNLIDAGLDRISISIEGTDSDKFERERVGAKFNVIKNNIEQLLELRVAMGTKHPRIRIQTVKLPGIDLDNYSRFWQPYCDEVAAVDFQDESKRINGETADWACPQLWQRMTIEWDGTVLPCNNDDPRSLSPGNAREKTVHECWHDKEVEQVRLKHKSGRSHEVDDCDGCPWRAHEINKIKPA